MGKILAAVKATAEQAVERAALTFGAVATGSAMIDAVNGHSWSAIEHVAVAAATAGAVAGVTVVHAAIKAALGKGGQA